MGRMRDVKFYIDPEDYERLREYAKRRGLKISEAVREIVKTFLSTYSESTVEKSREAPTSTDVAGGRYLEDELRRIVRRLDQLSTELGRLENEFIMFARETSRKLRKISKKVRELEKMSRV